MESKLDHTYWESRYQQKATGWDIGYISTPLKAYFDQLEDRNIRILIPGAGNAYEAGYLWEKNFEQVHILDIAESPLKKFSEKYPDFPKENVIQEDFFHHEGMYDLLIEQTFFCALDPSLRKAYVQKGFELLQPGGKIIGLLWNKPMNSDKPPFGGSEGEYRDLFSNHFAIQILETAYNSIPPRSGNESFISFRKKN